MFSKLLIASLVGIAVGAVKAQAETRKFTMYTVEASGVKMWVPSTIVVKKGDTVEVSASVKIPGPNPIHGFTIQDLKVVDVADDKGKTIKFVAEKAGIFPIRCHLHPAHLGGQLVVLE